MGASSQIAPVVATYQCQPHVMVRHARQVGLQPTDVGVGGLQKVNLITHSNGVIELFFCHSLQFMPGAPLMRGVLPARSRMLPEQVSLQGMIGNCDWRQMEVDVVGVQVFANGEKLIAQVLEQPLILPHTPGQLEYLLAGGRDPKQAMQRIEEERYDWYNRGYPKELVGFARR